MERQLLDRALHLCLLAGAAGCGPSVTTISMEPTAVTLGAQGSTAVVQASPKDRDGNPVVDAIMKIRWSSSNPAVVTVSPTGVVTAVGPGRAKVTATVGGAQGEIDATVSIPAAVALEPASLEILGVGEERTIKAKVTDESGQELTDAHVVWSTSNSRVVTINEGKLTSKGPGEAEIRVVLGKLSATATVKVTLPPVAKVELQPAELNIDKPGDAGRLAFSALDAEGRPIKGVVPEWSSGDESVAEVSDSGVVKGLKRGRTKVKVTVDGKAAEAVVNVR